MNDVYKGIDEKKKNIFESKKFMYIFLISLLAYILMSGYFLIFSGSVFIEGLIKGGYSSDSSIYDTISLFIGYLYGFASLCGVLGGLAVLSTPWNRFFKIKVVLFIPWVSWTIQLVIGNFRWGITYWTQWLHLVPMMSLSIFVLYCAIKKVNIPILKVKPKSDAPEKPSQVEVS